MRHLHSLILRNQTLESPGLDRVVKGAGELMRKLISICIMSIGFIACQPQIQEDIRQPKYFFHWNAQLQKGECLNSQGVEGYNPKLIGPCGDLRGYRFNASALDGADLRGAILDGMNLSEFSLNGANLKAVKARGVIFDGASLNGAKLNFGQFQGARFNGAQLSGADLSHGDFSGASFHKASVAGLDASHSDLSGALFFTDLSTVNLQDSLLSYGTRLPFSEKSAESHGMIPANKHYMDLAAITVEETVSEDGRSPASVKNESAKK